MTGVFLSVIMPNVKDLRYLQLFDTYGALLTDIQREMCEAYYLYDLSLSEIAEEKGVTKQSVSDTLKKSRELCEFYEEKLNIVGRQRELLAAMEELKNAHPEIGEEITKIADMVAGGELASGIEEK